VGATERASRSWMMIGTWRNHPGDALQASKALVAENNFRRAMEKSMRDRLRVIDLECRNYYVNEAPSFAFCAMTGWSENERVGQKQNFSVLAGIRPRKS